MKQFGHISRAAIRNFFGTWIEPNLRVTSPRTGIRSGVADAVATEFSLCKLRQHSEVADELSYFVGLWLIDKHLQWHRSCKILWL